jgi:single-strand DNA-binding protein
MNRIILIGNLTKDPEIRTTGTGKKVASFSLAINDGKDANGQDIVQYFNISAWDKKAEIAELYLKKGHKVAIVGRLQIKTWEKQDGTKASSPEIVAQDLELLTSRVEAERLSQSVQTENNNYNSAPSKPAATKTASAKSSNDDIPQIDVNNMDFNVQMPF